MSIGYSDRTRLLGSGLSAQVGSWLNRSLIKSIQAGTVAMTNAQTSNTATITTVNTANTVLIYLGSNYNNDADADASRYDGYLQLTNATTITGTRVTANATLTIAFMVLEFWPGIIKSNQLGTINTGAATSNTETITAVRVAKTVVFYLGAITNEVLGYGSRNTGTMVLTNATTVTFTRGNASDQLIGSYQVIEFF